jgi:N-carbamoylputrescine amidase
MPRIVKVGLVQFKAARLEGAFKEIKQASLEKHIEFVKEAKKKQIQILGLGELFLSPYFPPAQSPEWYDFAEPIPGPTTEIFSRWAREFEMVMVLPIFEKEAPGLYYNTAAVLDADGTYLGKYRKMHIPHITGGFFEKYYFKPGNLGYPVFETRYAKIGVYICYDRHFPEGARILALNGAEIIFNPCATVKGLSREIWKMEQRSLAIFNALFVATSNRVGVEPPWNIGEFYGSSYICGPNGKILSQASEEKEEIISADCDLDYIEEIRRTWPFFRDRRPETYEEIIDLSL